MSVTTPQEVEDQIVRLYRQGYSTRQVGARVGVSPTTVPPVLRRRGFSVRPRGGTNNKAHLVSTEEYRRTVALYEAGASVRQIARILKLNSTAVYWRLTQAGVRLRDRRESQLMRRKTEPFGKQLQG